MVWDPGGVVSDALRLPTERTVGGWAEDSVVLSERTSAEPGPLRLDRTPYLREPLACWRDVGVEQIVLMTGTQVGKTTALLAMGMYAVDQDPGPLLWCMAGEKTARDFSQERAKPVIDDSPVLRRHLTGVDDDFGTLKYRLDRMTWNFAWAGSPSQLSSRPVRYVIYDEVDKYPPFSGREADPVKLAQERQRTYVASRKRALASTPTTESGYIAREYKRSDRRRFHVPCPHCGVYFVLDFTHVRWPQEAGKDEILEDRLAWYECPNCRKAIDDGEKPGMLGRGVWCPHGCSVDRRGRIVGRAPVNRVRGYWLNALYSPWLTWSEVVFEHLDSLGDRARRMNFVNSWLAEVWVESSEEMTETQVENLEGDYDRGEVPEGVVVLTSGLDLQKRYIYYEVRGWGVDQESWLVEWALVQTFGEVEDRVLDRVFRKGNGEELRVAFGLMDSRYRTDEVYRFTRKHAPRLMAVQGATRRMTVPHEVRKIERHPVTGKRLKSSHRYWRVDTHYYKDVIFGLVENGKWHLHREVGQEYVSQFTSEHRVIEVDRYRRTREVWIPRSEGIENHLLDTGVYATAAADIKKVWALRGVRGQGGPSGPESTTDRGVGFAAQRKRWLIGR